MSTSKPFLVQRKFQCKILIECFLGRTGTIQGQDKGGKGAYNNVCYLSHVLFMVNYTCYCYHLPDGYNLLFFESLSTSTERKLNARMDLWPVNNASLLTGDRVHCDLHSEFIGCSNGTPSLKIFPVYRG